MEVFPSTIGWIHMGIRKQVPVVRAADSQGAVSFVAKQGFYQLACAAGELPNAPTQSFSWALLWVLQRVHLGLDCLQGSGSLMFSE